MSEYKIEGKIDCGGSVVIPDISKLKPGESIQVVEAKEGHQLVIDSIDWHKGQINYRNVKTNE